MPTNDELVRAIQRFVDQQAAYRAEITKSLLEAHRRIVAGEKLLIASRAEFDAKLGATQAELAAERAARLAAERSAAATNAHRDMRISIISASVTFLVVIFVVMVILSVRQ